jgi:membrane protein DedA with SNARE-associated domain
LLVLGLVHQYQEVGSPMAKYRDLAVGSGASWFGLPGPAEALLVAAGVLAAERQLDLVWVVALSWLGAIGGAIAGWLMVSPSAGAFSSRRGRCSVSAGAC